MLDHFSLSVKDYPQSLFFYDETLKILGYDRVITIDMPEHQVKCVGYGLNEGKRPYFWISPMGLSTEEVGQARGFHMAFTAPSQEAVVAWYHKCLELGGKDNGAPGPRAEYHPGYFGAFIIDPNGWRIEAVTHHYQGLNV